MAKAPTKKKKTKSMAGKTQNKSPVKPMTTTNSSPLSPSKPLKK